MDGLTLYFLKLSTSGRSVKISISQGGSIINLETFSPLVYPSPQLAKYLLFVGCRKRFRSLIMRSKHISPNDFVHQNQNGSNSSNEFVKRRPESILLLETEMMISYRSQISNILLLSDEFVWAVPAID